MSTIAFIESFDLAATSADLAARGFVGTVGVIGTTNGRFGGRAISGTATAGILSQGLGFKEFITSSFWFKADGTLSTGRIMATTDQANDVSIFAADVGFALNYIASGAILIQGDGGVTKATSAAGILQASTWHHIECQIQHATSGTVNIFVDGVLALTVAAQDFLESSNDTTMFLVGAAVGHIFDDWVVQFDAVAHPALLGEHRIHTLLPDGNTAQADWTGVFTDIDDPFGSDDGDTTFINTTTLNNKSEFSVANLPVTPTTVFAVQDTVVARKTDSGTKGVTPYIQSGVTREDGVEFGTSETYTTKLTMHELNPDTASAWTGTTVNAVLLGVEITT